jgi:hypothetical protein
MDSKISELDLVSVVDQNDVLPIVNGGITKKVKVSQLEQDFQSVTDKGASTTNSITVIGDVTAQNGRLNKLYLKSDIGNPDLSAEIAISKNITVATSHVIEESSTITPPTGADGYGIIDVITKVVGSNPLTHLHAFQSRLKYESNANMPIHPFNSMTGFFSEMQVRGTGVVDKIMGVKIHNTFATTSNKINNQYGVWIENQEAGAVNYGIWNDTFGNYFKGLSIGTTVVDTINALRVNGSAIATQYKVSALNTAPATATSTGTLGEIRYTSDFIYVCIATNTWRRTALTSW